MGRTSPRGRGAALLAAGALALHQLAYLTSYGEHAELALARHGHAYLSLAAALAVVLIAIAGLQLTEAIARARERGGSPEPRPKSLVGSWLGASAALMAVHVGQESIESLLSPAHPGALHGIVAHGGWLTVLAALAIGLLIALLLRGARAVVEHAAARRHAPLPVLAPAAGPSAGVAVSGCPPAGVLARHLAGRAPPSSLA